MPSSKYGHCKEDLKKGFADGAQLGLAAASAVTLMSAAAPEVHAISMVAVTLGAGLFKGVSAYNKCKVVTDLKATPVPGPRSKV